MAMTWNQRGIHTQGEALGQEFRGKAIESIQPLGESAWGGRQGETYGPDAYLGGIMSGQMIAGTAAAGVVLSAKYFNFNEQETSRLGSTSGGGGGGGGGGGVDALPTMPSRMELQVLCVR